MSAGIREREACRGAITLRGVFAVCLCGLVLAGGFAAFLWWGWRSMTTDYSRLAPADAFRRVFRRPLQRGVTDLRVAGYSAFAGTVGMRFRITEVGLRDLLANCPPERPEMFRAYLAGQLQSDWSREVGLPEIQRIRRPEYYAFSGVWQGSGWFGVLAVDREHHLVYVVAELM